MTEEMRFGSREPTSAPRNGVRAATALRLVLVLTLATSGAAVSQVDSHPDGDLRFVERAEDLAMPPDEELDAADVATLAAWIDAGVPWPRDSGVSVALRTEEIADPEILA